MGASMSKGTPPLMMYVNAWLSPEHATSILYRVGEIELLEKYVSGQGDPGTTSIGRVNSAHVYVNFNGLRNTDDLDTGVYVMAHNLQKGAPIADLCLLVNDHPAKVNAFYDSATQLVLDRKFLVTRLHVPETHYDNSAGIRKLEDAIRSNWKTAHEDRALNKDGVPAPVVMTIAIPTERVGYYLEDRQTTGEIGRKYDEEDALFTRGYRARVVFDPWHGLRDPPQYRGAKYEELIAKTNVESVTKALDTISLQKRGPSAAEITTAEVVEAVSELWAQSIEVEWSRTNTLFMGVGKHFAPSLCGWAGSPWASPDCTMQAAPRNIRCRPCSVFDRGANRRDQDARARAKIPPSNAVVWVVNMSGATPAFLVHRRAATMTHGAGKLAPISDGIDQGNNLAATVLLELSQEYATVGAPLRHPGKQLRLIGFDGTAAVFVIFVQSEAVNPRAPPNEVDPVYGHRWITASSLIEAVSSGDFWRVAASNLRLFKKMTVIW